MHLTLVTAAAATPIDLTTVKRHLNISHTVDDTLLTALIDVATAMLDGPSGLLRRALVTQTWYAFFRDFPVYSTAKWRLPVPPLQSVTAITYLDLDGVRQTVDAADYIVVAPHGAAGYVELADDSTWPGNLADRSDAVRIEFVAGYGAATAVPAPIRQAMLLLVGELYANRGDNAEGGPASLAPGMELITPNAAAVRALCSRYLWREPA